MAAYQRARQRAHKPIIMLVFVVIGIFVSGDGVLAQQSKLHQSKIEVLPTPQPYSRSKTLTPSGPGIMLNDRKKSLADNEVFDGTTKEQLQLLLSELREVRTEIREARQEHGRLASGVAEISDQVKVISDRKDQIKKKIRKLTKTLSKKDHQRKMKGGLRSLQQDHERILQAMSKAKLINRTSNRRNNRTNNHRNHTNGHHNNHIHNTNTTCKDVNTNETDSQSFVNGTRDNFTKTDNKSNGARNNHGGEVEVIPETNTQIVHPIEIEKKTPSNQPKKHLPAQLVPNPVVASSLASAPTFAPTTITTSTTNTPVPTTTTSTTPAPTTTTTSTTSTTTSTTTTPKPTTEPLPANCYEVLQHGNWTSGVYTIQPGSMNPVKVWCDQRTDGGGWTLVVARKPLDAQEDFSRSWDDYKNGFGEPTKEHWIGLETIHQLTKDKRHELRVNISDWQDNIYHAQWKEFSVADEEHAYKLTIGRYASSTSTAGDALKWHNSMKFSTLDRDNDALMGGHCALQNQGGWWYRGYRGCYQAHPTGVYQRLSSEDTEDSSKAATEKPATTKKGRNTQLGPFLYWVNWRGSDLYPKTMFLMLRPSPN